MDKYPVPTWAKAISFVSDVYDLTKSFPGGEPEVLGYRIRKTAISLSFALNNENSGEPVPGINDNICPVLSLTSILETYIIMAGEQFFGREVKVLYEKVRDLKKLIENLDRLKNEYP